MIFNASMIAALSWFVVATILAAIPSNDHHWRRAYFLMAVGFPILIWVGYQNGPWVALVFFLAGCSFLRWPVIYLWRWVRSRVS